MTLRDRSVQCSVAMILYCLSVGVGLGHRCAIAEQAVMSVEPFQPLHRLERAPANATLIPGDISHKNAYYVGKWTAVEPWWLVGMIESGPYWPGSPTPERWPEPRARSIIVVDIRNGNAQRLRTHEQTQYVSEVFAFKAGHLAFTIADESETSASNVRLWVLNIKDGHFEQHGWWNKFITPIARCCDLHLVKVEETGSETTAEHAARLTLIDAGTFTDIPLPHRQYRRPLGMTELWEQGKQTRWYAPAGDGVGVVVFQGDRMEKTGQRPVRSPPYSPKSRLICFDPKEASGVRWSIQLNASEWSNEARMGVVPITSAWKKSDELILQCGCVDATTKKQPVSIVTLACSDGKRNRRTTFDSDEGFELYRNWPHCNADSSRLVYLVEHPKNTTKVVAYDVGAGRFELEIDGPSPSRQDLVSVLPSDEALLQDEDSLWLIGVGRKNYGVTKRMLRLFLEE